MGRNQSRVNDEVSISFIPKPEDESIRKDLYKTISFTNIDARSYIRH